LTAVGLHAFESVLITYGVRMRVPSRVIDPWIAGLAGTTFGAGHCHVVELAATGRIRE